MIIEMPNGELLVVEDISVVQLPYEDEISIYLRNRPDGINYEFDNEDERNHVLKQIKSILAEQHAVHKIDTPPISTYIDFSLDDKSLTVYVYTNKDEEDVTDATIQIENEAGTIIATVKHDETIELAYGDYKISAIVSDDYLAPKIEMVSVNRPIFVSVEKQFSSNNDVTLVFRSAETNKPIKDLSVEIESDDDLNYDNDESDENGCVKFNNLLAGKYKITIEDSSYTFLHDQDSIFEIKNSTKRPKSPWREWLNL